MSESPFIASTFGRAADPARVGGLSDLRQIDLNMYYIIKEKVLPLNGYVGRFSETVTAGTQETDPVTGLQVTPYKATNNDWVYFNPDVTNPALTGLLTAPILSVSGAVAWTDYLQGIVYYSGVTVNSIDITYDYYTVYVQDGYPDYFDDIKDWSDIRVPLVTVEYLRRRNKPFEIGGRFEQDRIFNIDVIANSDAQRDDIADVIEDSLRYSYNNTIDYSAGFPIYFNGDKNPSFSRSGVWKQIRFENVDSRVLRDPYGIDKLRHRTIINLDVKTYD